MTALNSHETEAFIDYWLEGIARHQRADPDLLSLAVRRALIKKYARASSPQNFFKNPLIRLDRTTLDKIRFIADWLREEKQCSAPWLSQCDEQGRPKVLVRSDLESLCIFAKKQQSRSRQPKEDDAHPPLPLPDMSDDPAENFHLEIDNRTRKAWETTKKVWRRFSSSATSEEFYREMTSGLPKGTQLLLKLDPKGSLTYLRYRYDVSVGNDKPEYFVFQRNFSDGNAYDSGDVVTPRLRNRGFFKIASQHLFRFYQKLGIKEISLTAGYMGAYVHARVGYVPLQDDWDEIKKGIGKRLDFIEQHPSSKDGPLPYTYVDALRKALASDKPKSLWFIVDQEHSYYGTSLGELLTMPLEVLPKSFPREKAIEERVPESFRWRGILDMHDPDCVQRYKAYLYADKKTPSPQQKLQPAALGARQ